MPTDAPPTHLTKLGNPDSKPDRAIESFPIDDPSQVITLECGEFTCRCPITGQPDWATISIEYRPNKRAVETKSLKLYLETFREEAIFHEQLATRMRDDLIAALDPVAVTVTVKFNSRGGIAVNASSSHPR